MGGSHSDYQKGDLTDGDLSKIRSNTHFTQEEIRQWYERFHQDFPDGVISKEAFIQMYKEMYQEGDVEDFAEYIFRSYDQDGNGEIDFREFVCTMSVTSRGNVDEKLEWAFNMYDIDNDGYITREESSQIIQSIVKMRGEEDEENHVADDLVEELFLAMDKNKDDVLSRSEFVHAAKHSKVVSRLISPT